jgi:hypothetical protein
MMVAQWSQKRTYVYRIEEVSFVGTGTTPTTIGPGGDIDTRRPTKVASAYARIPSTGGAGVPSDIQLTVLQAREDYNKIRTKNLGSFPSAVFLDTKFPVADLYVWPIPNSQYTIYLGLMQQLTQFDNLSDDIDLPPEYEAALMFNLGALFISPAYKVPVTEDLRRAAISSLNSLEQTNHQIPALDMPQQISTRGRYNIYGDTTS